MWLYTWSVVGQRHTQCGDRLDNFTTTASHDLELEDEHSSKVRHYGNLRLWILVRTTALLQLNSCHLVTDTNPASSLFLWAD